jgi:hypothetical protein
MAHQPVIMLDSWMMKKLHQHSKTQEHMIIREYMSYMLICVSYGWLYSLTCWVNKHDMPKPITPAGVCGDKLTI